MKELNLSELSIKQKVGLTMCGHINNQWDEKKTEDNILYALDMIKNHSLGAIWVCRNFDGWEDAIKRVKEVADYPILIMTDAEQGFGENIIGKHNAIGMTGREDLAYTFGKVTAAAARKVGYNVVCSPLLDLVDSDAYCNMTIRSYGSDKIEVTRLAAAEARGMHDAGVLTVGKHYPGGRADAIMDTHMGEGLSYETEEELIDYFLYPYIELDKMGLLDGMMTGHVRFPNIDPENPASLSSKMIGIIRDKGFDGISITDDLCMQGIVAKYGKTESRGLAVQNGNDLALPWLANEVSFNAMWECYEKGVLTEERVNEAAARVLRAQHKLTLIENPQDATEDDMELFEKLNTDCVWARADEGLDHTVSKDGRHLFFVLTPNGTQIDDMGNLGLDTFTDMWYRPDEICKQIKETFPNSGIYALDEFPTSRQNWRLLSINDQYDDLVFITFVSGAAYQGDENLTGRVLSEIRALQLTNRISALVHFGNPFVLEKIDSHIPRVIIGGQSAKAINSGIKVLAGDYPAKGKLTYDIKLK